MLTASNIQYLCGKKVEIKKPDKSGDKKETVSPTKYNPNNPVKGTGTVSPKKGMSAEVIPPMN